MKKVMYKTKVSLSLSLELENAVKHFPLLHDTTKTKHKLALPQIKTQWLTSTEE